MCHWIQPEGWDDWANVLVLCEENAFEHLLEQLGFNQQFDRAATSVMRTFAHAAACVIFEKYYFDIDHRSEVELVQAKQFTPVEVTTDRLHFFSMPFDISWTVHQYLEHASEKANEENGDGAPTYLGYTVVKQRDEARIGRSLISPWAEAPFRSADPEKASPFATKFGYARDECVPVNVVYEQVRTAVPESVNIYGIDFRAVGIPFMEQDGYVLRCAHVSAWICHYSAVLRGFISRKTTGQIHRAGDTTTSVARRYPSSGISSHEIAALLREVNLAPETLGWDELNEDRSPTWADRAELVASHRKLTAAVEAARDEDEEAEALRARSSLWIRENLSATVCRYLNSGLPMILIRRLTGHTQVIVGYLRESDLAGERGTAPRTEGHSDVVAFLVSDDQEGPFELVPVEEIVGELADDPTSNEVFIPLPDTVWVESSMAERVGTARLLSIAERRLKRAPDSGLNAEGTAQLQRFVIGLTSEEDVYTIRTYVTAGTDFKRSAAERMKACRHAVAAVRRTQLPRFVWVCEVIDRDLRRDGKESVVGTIVLDATQLLHNIGPGSHTEDAEPLFAHIPSQFYAPPFLVTATGIYPEYNEEQRITEAPRDPDEVMTVGDEPPGFENDYFWYPSNLPPYWTGRWSHQRLVGLAASTVASFAKGATS